MAKEKGYLAPFCFVFGCTILVYLNFGIPNFNILLPQPSFLASYYHYHDQDHDHDHDHNHHNHFSSFQSPKKVNTPENNGSSSNPDPFVNCDGRYIYVHELPRRFNEDLLDDCENLVKKANMCTYLVNDGFGPEILHNNNTQEDTFQENGWYDTNQFSLELIFHRRINQYDCLTRDSSIAAAIYVPFYSGFDISRHLDNYTIQVRDALAIDLVNWVKNASQWKLVSGQDHFIVSGRITWDMRRFTDNQTDFGNKFLLIPQVQNMTTINIESSPWDSNNFAIPYPTYFHPSQDSQVISWQDKIRGLNREWLFSFAGGPRPWDPKSIRNNVFDQCKRCNSCKLLECAHEGSICTPGGVMKMFQNSVFCLQPPGDSPTRKSTFDSILAGCIPVFFHPGSAYTQYIWHLPKNYSNYSVFIWEDDIRKKNVNIEDTLRKISSQRIQEIREGVIDLIPRLIYADPRSKSRTFKDAFDVCLEAVIQRVRRLKGMNVSDDQAEETRTHEWDKFMNV